MSEIFTGSQDALEVASIRGSNTLRWKAPSGQQIKALRDRIGLSQASFAKEYGIELSTLKNWEQGRTVPETASRQILWMIDADPLAALNLIRLAQTVSPEEVPDY